LLKKTHFTLLKTTFLQVFFLKKKLQNSKNSSQNKSWLDLESFENQNWAGGEEGEGFWVGEL
jgi:hypothetical protein